MPLTLCGNTNNLIVKKVGGSTEVRQHLNELGFNVGTEVSVISDIGGNLIVSVKNCRIALNKAMASKIFV